MNNVFVIKMRHEIRVTCQLLILAPAEYFLPVLRIRRLVLCCVERALTAVNNYPSTQIINLQSHHCFHRARRQIWTGMNLLNCQAVF